MVDTKYYNATVPIQKLPMSKKTDEWRKANVDAFIGKAVTTGSDGMSEVERLKVKYDLYNGKFNLEDIEYVTNPFKVEDSFPASPQNINIIRPKIDLLIGEESKKPFNLKVVQTDLSAKSKYEEVQQELLFKAVMNKILGNTPQEGEPETPKQIQDYMQYSYTSIGERTAHYMLKYLKEKLNISNEFLKGWKDALIAGKEIYYTGIIGSEPYVERVNPIGFYFDKSPDVEFIEDGEWAVRHMLMTPSSVYDRFYDIMEESDLNKLLELSGGETGTKNTGSNVNYSHIVYRDMVDRGYTSSYGSIDEYIDVYHVTWRSYKKIGFLTFVDETGEPQTILVDESYKFDEADKAAGNEISWNWVTEVWEGYKIGGDIYVGIEPLQNQFFRIENLNSNKLPYTGAIYSDDNSEYTSLLDTMTPLQYLYIIIWYRLELALSRDKGKILNMDITQIPKSFGIDVSRWAHYVSAMGINFINPYEEGWDIPGRAGGTQAAFNQMSAQDLSMAKVIDDYVRLMDKIEQMIGELSGVSKQRQGAISQNELVGNVERSVVQSSHITEPLFWKHNQVKKRVLTMLLEAAKSVYSDSDKEYLHFILDDTSRMFLNISKDFSFSEFDIFVSDSTKEDRNIQSLQGLLQPALQAGASLAEAAEILISDNLVEIKNKLAAIDVRRQQLESERAAQEQQAVAQAKEMEMEMKQEELRIKEEDSLRKANTDIEVALINANSAMNTANLKNNESKDDSKIELEKAKVDETIRKNKAQESIKKKELELKKKQINKSNQSKSK